MADDNSEGQVFDQQNRSEVEAEINNGLPISTLETQGLCNGEIPVNSSHIEKSSQPAASGDSTCNNITNVQPVISVADLMSSLLAANNPENMLGQRRLNLLDTIKQVPLFTGDDPNFTFNRFKEIFQQCASYFDWSPEDQMFGIKLRLAGSAHSTFLTFQHQIKNVDDVFKILKNRFVKDKHPSDVISEFWSFKQTPSMPVNEYIAQARQKVRADSVAQGIPPQLREEIEEKWLLAMLLKNMNPNILRGVISRNPQTLEELESIAKCEENAWQATNSLNSVLNPKAQEFVAKVETVNKKRDDPEVSELRQIVNTLSVKIDSMADQVQVLMAAKGGTNNNVSRNNTGVNFNKYFCRFCNLQGHIQRYCPQLMQNSNYNNPQHFQPNSNNGYQNRGFSRGGQRGHSRGMQYSNARPNNRGGTGNRGRNGFQNRNYTNNSGNRGGSNNSTNSGDRIATDNTNMTNQKETQSQLSSVNSQQNPVSQNSGNLNS